MIRIENVHKSFGKLEVLKDISMEVQQGEVVALIGPSGSGNPPCCVVSIAWRCQPMDESISEAKT